MNGIQGWLEQDVTNVLMDPDIAVDRIKLQVWSVDQQRWRTVYVRKDLLLGNVVLLHTYGFKVRLR
jgi:hypothetical protein